MLWSALYGCRIILLFIKYEVFKDMSCEIIYWSENIILDSWVSYPSDYSIFVWLLGKIWLSGEFTNFVP